MKDTFIEGCNKWGKICYVRTSQKPGEDLFNDQIQLRESTECVVSGRDR